MFVWFENDLLAEIGDSLSKLKSKNSAAWLKSLLEKEKLVSVLIPFSETWFWIPKPVHETANLQLYWLPLEYVSTEMFLMYCSKSLGYFDVFLLITLTTASLSEWVEYYNFSRKSSTVLKQLQLVNARMPKCGILINSIRCEIMNKPFPSEYS